MRSDPKMNKDRTGLPRGLCSECGRSFLKRNSDGKISKHGECLGSGRPPAVASVKAAPTRLHPRRSS